MRTTFPVNAIVQSANRNWTDGSNGQPKDYIPQDAELGPLSNSNFGTVVVNTRWADDIRQGWFTRPSSWQYTGAVSQELRPGVGVEVAYYRTSFGNFTVTDNTLVTPTDYSTYCVTAPVASVSQAGAGSFSSPKSRAPLPKSPARR